MTAAGSQPASTRRRQLPPIVAAVLTVLASDLLAAAVVAGVRLGSPHLADRIACAAWQESGARVVGAGQQHVPVCAGVGPTSPRHRGASPAVGG